MELNLISKFFTDKEIVNPANPEEIFTCKDLMQDYNVCRRERRFQTNTGNVDRKRCYEYRKMAFKCYWMEEDAFLDLLMDKYDEKVKFVEFLEQEGSILARQYKDKASLFRVRNTQLEEWHLIIN